jgi:hypothetical protein
MTGKRKSGKKNSGIIKFPARRAVGKDGKIRVTVDLYDEDEAEAMTITLRLSPGDFQRLRKNVAKERQLRFEPIEDNRHSPDASVVGTWELEEGFKDNTPDEGRTILPS